MRDVQGGPLFEEEPRRDPGPESSGGVWGLKSSGPRAVWSVWEGHFPWTISSGVQIQSTCEGMTPDSGEPRVLEGADLGFAE